MGFFLGYCVCAIILKVVASGVVAIFVCFAEDPAALYNNRPDEFARLSGIGNEHLTAYIAQEGIGQSGVGQTGQTTAAPQQVYVQQPVQQQVVYVQAAPVQPQEVMYQEAPPHYQGQQPPPQYQGQQPPPQY